MSQKNKNRGFPLPVVVAILLFVVIVALFITGWLRLGDPRTKYEVFGVDVSSYQGDINWLLLEQDGVDFAYIKATEGSSHLDPCFEQNWQGASETEILVGAYHFMSFDSPGDTQALNFIGSVPKLPGNLPPAIDLELYGNYVGNPPDREDVREILDVLIAMLRARYGVDPVIYINENLFVQYLYGDDMPDCTIWVVDTIGSPRLKGKDWAFWQYSHRGQLSGYDGVEQYIDLNVFNGSREELEQMLTQ